MTVDLGTKDCVAVALYMWDEYLEYVHKPQVSIVSFPEWLRSFQTPSNQP